MDRKRAQLIDRLESSGQDYLWILNRLEETEMLTPPPPGEWTVHQIAAHMRDTEQQVFLLRTELMIDEAHPAVLNFDQAAWNREHYLASEPLRKINADFRTARRTVVRLLRRATKKAWENWAVHPEYGKISLDWLLEHDYHHTLEHIAQIGSLHEAETLKKLNGRLRSRDAQIEHSSQCGLGQCESSTSRMIPMEGTMAFENIVVSVEGPIALVQLNRPKVLNALNGALMTELADALEELDRNEAIRCMVVYGSDRAFSAGADIDQMKSATPLYMLQNNWINRNFDRIRKITKPIVAAVSGYCLGGGCELAMSCDIMIASETAKFGQPEISIGIMPGAGGTQRLPRAIGKSRAMELILTGKSMTAKEAEARGLVARVVPPELYLEEAKNVAREIATKPPVAVRFAKEAVSKVYELPLTEGLEYESRLFNTLFSTEDQKEGMDAFLNKRKPEWKGK